MIEVLQWTGLAVLALFCLQVLCHIILFLIPTIGKNYHPTFTKKEKKILRSYAFGKKIEEKDRELLYRAHILGLVNNH